jgi:hypothetical protein
MAEKKDFPLSLTIRAIDKATEPLRAINKRIAEITSPARKLNNALRGMAIEAGLPKVASGIIGVGRAARGVASEVLSLSAKIGGLGALAGYTSYRIISGAVESGDKLGEMAQRVGLGVDAYAQLQFAAAQADVDQEQFNASMDRFSKGLGEAKAGTGSLLAFLERVSPVLARQVKGSKGTEEALMLVGSAFERIQDPAKRAALAGALFGKSGLQMGQFLGAGNKAIGEQRKKFLELAGTQGEFERSAGDVDNAMREISVAAEGARNAIFVELSPAILELSAFVRKFVVENRDGISRWAREVADAIRKWIQSGGLERLTVGIRSISESAKNLIDRMGGLKNAAMVVAGILSSGLLLSVANLGFAILKAGWAIGGVLLKAFMLIEPWLAAIPWASLGIAIGNVGLAIEGSAVVMAPFVAAMAAGTAGAIAFGAAGLAIYRNWSNVKELFTDFFGRGGLPATILEGFKGKFTTGDLFKNAWQFYGGEIDRARKPIGAASAAPIMSSSPAVNRSEAHVSIDMSGVPRGAKIMTEASPNMSIDLSRGYSAVTP